MVYKKKQDQQQSSFENDVVKTQVIILNIYSILFIIEYKLLVIFN